MAFILAGCSLRCPGTSPQCFSHTLFINASFSRGTSSMSETLGPIPALTSLLVLWSCCLTWDRTVTLPQRWLPGSHESMHLSVSNSLLPLLPVSVHSQASLCVLGLLHKSWFYGNCLEFTPSNHRAFSHSIQELGSGGFIFPTNWEKEHCCSFG